MDRTMLMSVLDMCDKDQIIKTVKSPDQTVLDVSFDGKGIGKRKLFKRAPEIVEGDPVSMAVTVTNPKPTPFPGGRLVVGVQYAGDKNQVPVVEVPPLKPSQKLRIEIETVPALKEGMANVYIYGRTSAGQAIMITTNRTQICLPEASITCFRVWPLSSVYSTITIILASMSLLVAMTAFLVSMMK